MANSERRDRLDLYEFDYRNGWCPKCFQPLNFFRKCPNNHLVRKQETVKKQKDWMVEMGADTFDKRNMLISMLQRVNGWRNRVNLDKWEKMKDIFERNKRS